MKPIPRLRMFAGPNGSGKSTLKSVLAPELLGIYLNPDEIENEILRSGGLDVSSYSVITSREEVSEYFIRSTWYRRMNLDLNDPKFENGRIIFERIPTISYLAAAVTDFLRSKLIDQRQSFTFETVMSHPSKIELLNHAKQQDFRTNLYYVATDNVSINISRVKSRVAQGGHSVPEEKIRTRYIRSLALLMDAIRQTNRAYIFDNSVESKDHTWLAEITNGQILEMKSNEMRTWFKQAVLDKIDRFTVLRSSNLELPD